MKFYIITCAASREILPVTMHLLDKYGPKSSFEGGRNDAKQSFQGDVIDLGKNDISRWTLDIYEQLKDETDEHIIFSLDDYLPIDHWDQEFLNSTLLRVSDFSRFELGYGAYFNKPNYETVYADVSIYEYGRTATYRVSCQTSIWKTEILLNVLKEKARTPWQFEVKANIPGKVICTRDKYAFRWIEESALSKRHSGKINILGLRPADVEELINLGHLNPERLQYGMRKEPNPPYVPGRPIPFDPGPKYQKFYI